MTLSIKERNEMVESFIDAYMAWMKKVASRYMDRLNPIEDLMQAGLCSAVHGAGSYDPDKGKPQTWLMFWFKAGIKNYKRDHGFIIRPKRGEIPLQTCGYEPESNDSYTDFPFDDICVSIALEDLSDRHKTIIYESYFNGRLQKEIAPIIGICQMQVSRDRKKALSDLQERLSA